MKRKDRGENAYCFRAQFIQAVSKKRESFIGFEVKSRTCSTFSAILCSFHLPSFLIVFAHPFDCCYYYYYYCFHFYSLLIVYCGLFWCFQRLYIGNRTNFSILLFCISVLAAVLSLLLLLLLPLSCICHNTLYILVFRVQFHSLQFHSLH